MTGAENAAYFARELEAERLLSAALRADLAKAREEVERLQKEMLRADEVSAALVAEERRVAGAAEAALATERARALEEAAGFEGHPPGVCLEHGRFRLEGAGLIDTEGPLSLCTGCGQLPPHAGCQAICAACAPPTGACYCAGCQVAGKASPPPAQECDHRMCACRDGCNCTTEGPCTAPAPQGEERCPGCGGTGFLRRRYVGPKPPCPICNGTGRAPRAEEGDK